MTLKINQPISLRIELLRAHGFSNEDIIARLKSGELPPIPFGEGNVDFTILIEFAKNHWEQAEQAIRSGYRVTFHTINGIKSLLAAKFGLLADRDYQDRGEFLDEIRLQASDVDWLRSVLADNWCLTECGLEDGEKLKSIKISLAAEPLR
jgi:hypothetical protein